MVALVAAAVAMSVSACSSSSPSTTFASLTRRAETVCRSFHPPGQPSAGLLVSQPTVVRDVEAIDRLAHESNSPWDKLPSGTFVAECHFVVPAAPASDTTLLCPDGTSVVVPASLSYFVDEEGRFSVVPSVGATAGALLCPSL